MVILRAKCSYQVFMPTIRPYYVYVPVNRTYSIRAEYKTGSETVNAIDGTNLRVLSVTDACTEKCYVIENEKLDARLKHGFP